MGQLRELHTLNKKCFLNETTDLQKTSISLLMRAGGEKSAETPFFETTVFQRVQLFSNKKRFQKVSRQSQTRAILPENVSKAQLPTPPGLRERSNQRLTFFLEGHGSLWRHILN